MGLDKKETKVNAKQDEFNPNPRMVELWRLLIDMERTWKGFSPLPDLNKSMFGVMMCVAHGGKGKDEVAQADAPPVLESEKKPVAVGFIAAQMQQSLPAISQKISALEELGYITRLADATDRRVTCVALTEIGVQKLREGREQFEAKLAAAFDAMGEARMQQLVELLHDLNEAFKKNVIPPQPKENKATKGE